VYQFHTRTKTGRSRALHQAAPDAWVELNPADADPLGIAEGDWVRVESPRGSIEVRARIGQVMPGAVFAPFHYGHWDPDDLAAIDSPVEGPADRNHRLANELTMTVWDPVSKQPYFKTAACKVTKVRDGDGPAPAPTTTASAPRPSLPRPASPGSDRRTGETHGVPSPPPGPPTTSHVLENTPTYPLDPTQRRS
ncbi:MAG: fdhF, partial [Marmoricola sp.]|nr:fdhF [Marmoricola sp.]